MSAYFAWSGTVLIETSVFQTGTKPDVPGGVIIPLAGALRLGPTNDPRETHEYFRTKYMLADMLALTMQLKQTPSVEQAVELAARMRPVSFAYATIYRLRRNQADVYDLLDANNAEGTKPEKNGSEG